MTGPFFVDTNLLVYARDSSEPVKQPRALDWMTYLWRSGRGRLSTQVLHEYYVVAARKLSSAMSREVAREDIRSLLAWQPLNLEPQVAERAWDVEDHFSLSFWDALIVAAAQMAGCRQLLTEDLSAGLRINDLEVVDPFTTPPPA